MTSEDKAVKRINKVVQQLIPAETKECVSFRLLVSSRSFVVNRTFDQSSYNSHEFFVRTPMMLFQHMLSSFQIQALFV